MGCEASGTMYPHPASGHPNVSSGVNCQYQAVKGLGSGDIPQGDDMANTCEPPQTSSRKTGARYCSLHNREKRLDQNGKRSGPGPNGPSANVAPPAYRWGLSHSLWLLVRNVVNL
jgi:hypothetical protein